MLKEWISVFVITSVNGGSLVAYGPTNKRTENTAPTTLPARQNRPRRTKAGILQREAGRNASVSRSLA